MYKLSPSDFAFLYEECKLRYYLKIKHGIEHHDQDSASYNTNNEKINILKDFLDLIMKV